MLYSGEDNLEGIKYEIWNKLKRGYFIKEKWINLKSDKIKYFKTYDQAIKQAEIKYR